MGMLQKYRNKLRADLKKKLEKDKALGKRRTQRIKLAPIDKATKKKDK